MGRVFPSYFSIFNFQLFYNHSRDGEDGSAEGEEERLGDASEQRRGHGSADTDDETGHEHRPVLQHHARDTLAYAEQEHDEKRDVQRQEEGAEGGDDNCKDTIIFVRY